MSSTAVRAILIVLAFLLGIRWLWRKLLGAAAGKHNGPASRRAEVSAEKVFPCAHCGVHVPESEGVRVNGRFYCSEAHRCLAERT
ncbi:MAG: hypothetical protein FWD62_07710 [Betaproteobacteria bacterium]|nr:hypothetical protein [Betaproteobacteria bacterium]